MSDPVLQKKLLQNTLDQLFRRQAGQLVATLTRLLGPGRMDLAESVVQDALLAAMQTWPLEGTPENPAGWLMRVAKNRALDALRKEKLVHGKEDEVARTVEGQAGERADAELAREQDLQELKDDQLRLLFICCHPALPRDAQIPLALKTLFGLGVPEIAAAFLAETAAVAQRLVRAKGRIRDAGLKYELPAPAELPERLPAVVETLYLLFSEGYNTHGGDQLTRKDVCFEAMRLGALLAADARFKSPELDALLALMCFNASRLDARTDQAGDILLLEEQDRSLWDQELITAGVRYLEAAMAGDALTPYHLQAGIAACHALAPSAAATDWPAVVAHYDTLLALSPSPVVALNRAVAVAMAQGPEAGLAALAPLRDDPALKGYYLLPGIEGELLSRVGDHTGAASCFRAALTCNLNQPERRWLERRLNRQ